MSPKRKGGGKLWAKRVDSECVAVLEGGGRCGRKTSSRIFPDFADMRLEAAASDPSENSALLRSHRS